MMRLGLSAVALSLGCSHAPPEKFVRAAIEGAVALDGQPLADGEIVFIPTAGGTMAGAKIAAGKFKLGQRDGPTIGLNRVEIRSVQPTGRIIDSPMTPEGVGPQAGESKVMEHKEIVPKRYNNESVLKVEVEAGVVNSLNLELETPTAPKK